MPRIRKPAAPVSVMASERLLVSELEVAALCGVSRPTVRNWAAAGLLERVELPFNNRRALYRRVDVDAFVAELESSRPSIVAAPNVRAAKS